MSKLSNLEKALKLIEGIEVPPCDFGYKIESMWLIKRMIATQKEIKD
jgi:hypothetical protein